MAIEQEPPLCHEYNPNHTTAAEEGQVIASNDNAEMEQEVVADENPEIEQAEVAEENAEMEQVVVADENAEMEHITINRMPNESIESIEQISEADDTRPSPSSFHDGSADQKTSYASVVSMQNHFFVWLPVISFLPLFYVCL